VTTHPSLARAGAPADLPVGQERRVLDCIADGGALNQEPGTIGPTGGGSPVAADPPRGLLR
jgi:hypothetical protein